MGKYITDPDHTWTLYTHKSAAEIAQELIDNNNDLIEGRAPTVIRSISGQGSYDSYYDIVEIVEEKSYALLTPDRVEAHFNHDSSPRTSTAEAALRKYR